MAVVDVRAVAQALQTARNTLAQLQEAQRLYQSMNSLSNIRGVANLLDRPILRDALPGGVNNSLDLLSSDLRDLGAIGTRRSEEHTSELQSLMRISYAVFCLKK